MIRRLTKSLYNNPIFHSTRNNKYWMAKGAKPGKQQPKQPQPIVQVLTPQEQLQKFLNFGQNSISPSQKKIIEEGFDDIGLEEQDMIRKLADEIIALQTPSFRELEQWGGLGTSGSYFTVSEELSEEQLESAIRRLRKEE